MYKKRKRGSENEGRKKRTIENAKNYEKLKRAKVSCADKQARQKLNQEDYLKMVVLKNNVGQRLTLINFISLYNTMSISAQNVRRHGL